MTPTGPASRRLTLLFTCVGRRIELLQAFRAAAARLGIGLRIVATDTTPTAPGILCADEPVLVPQIDDAAYIPTLLDLAQRVGAAALIPTIDTDLPILAANRERFSALGCTAMVGDAQAVGYCRDKIRTYELLKAGGFDTPLTCTAEEMLARSQHRFPYFLKPRHGSAGRSTCRIDDAAALQYFGQRVERPIVQEFVSGAEHTLDAYVGLTGRVGCVVPRRRWQIRDGEVSKGVVVKDLELMEATRRVVELLGPSMRGLVTVQCIVTPDRRFRFIEINPRFGGGAPLSIAAGADFPGWLMQELLGEPPEIRFDGFAHGLCMLRYDWSAFVQLDEELKPQLRPTVRPWPAFE